MELTCREIRNLARALPFLGDYYFRIGRNSDGVAAVRAAKKLREMDEDNRGTVQEAMINAFGEFDRASGQRVVKSTSKRFDEYIGLLKELLEEEHEVEIPFSISYEVAGELESALLVDLEPLIEEVK